MSRHYLYGPVQADFAKENLSAERQTRRCVAFNAAGDTDLAIGSTDTWKSIRERLPAGWQPEFLVLNLWYTSIPSCLWQTSLPIIGLAVDWNLQWHCYRRQLPQCDLILTDTLGVET